MLGADQRWFVYDDVGAIGFSRSFEIAVAQKNVQELTHPENGPYLLVVYFFSKVTGTLIQGALVENANKLRLH